MDTVGTRHDFTDIASGPTLDIDPDKLATGTTAALTNSGSAGGSFSAAGAAQPVCQVGPLGHKELDFDGTDDVMTSALTLGNVAAAAAYTFFAVVKIDAVDTNAANAYDNDAVFSAGAEYFGMHLKSAPTFVGWHFDGAGAAPSVSTATGTYLLLQIRYDGTKVYARSAGGSESAGTTAGSLSSVADTIRLGRNGGTAFFDGKIVRLLGFNTSLAASDITSVRARLAALYSVTI